MLPRGQANDKTGKNAVSLIYVCMVRAILIRARELAFYVINLSASYDGIFRSAVRLAFVLHCRIDLIIMME